MWKIIFREKMAQAYDFALEKIGMDLHSFIIWSDYVAFLKSVEAVGSYAENQKIAAIRKVSSQIIIDCTGNHSSYLKRSWRSHSGK